MNEKKVTNEDLAKLISNLSVTTDGNTKAIDLISKTTLKILETMATKEELNIVKKDVSGIKTELVGVKKDVSVLKTDVSDLKTDQKSFRTETRESFNRLEKNLKENEESVGAVVADYHPHIIALEEKVFGSSTLE
ncbi:hypothetical protein A2643_00880 [Candidatus Nomurabacteria bacterium RIFCSPHIGHO2_01_FULL_39_220]|uniref:Uncharacterized protein n=1 Tax=Candidatus Nomurabacteria bacterium RIFCSPLOWO2_02_FULL_40_67 TaxID=1801787 RepID=A0A1F6Y4D0_9BACT|nr:MAG: hypothetical protein UU01_C0002G0096 [Parcubacteria group bacterium GW2011_GWA2_40_37]KKS33153.1 MAG: hypothetical protein UU96_C0031G0008 [Parcubacteria group bacterium GW2011_GWC2_42_13]OGI62111.1 MAG: hypothetical protein A2W12_02015 [Candidatus Nomurabacteria bacterium RBG_16_40_11]OGI70326.1 MAG: hypothetical protein A2643_00880 [Candidatus Nomurabacteria bacterium RIFCSPHIGHO2_01_FULL_39_220]OGI73529.1 MAG: hypothetical protein A2W56_02480 [Candidatus Nomurabacteria bacterium RIFC